MLSFLFHALRSGLAFFAKLIFRGAAIAALCTPTLTISAATTTATSTTATQSQSSNTSAIPPLPHGSCPERYQLDFVAQKWIRCNLKRDEIEKGAPKMPSNVAPKCDADYALRGPNLSNAPEKSMYQCLRFQR